TVTGTQSGIVVNPARTAKFVLTGYPSPIVAGSSGTLTITALDAFGNLTPTYTGIVHFTSSDSKAVLPANYTFVAGDNGVHTFSVTLKTAASQSITATDALAGSVKGSQTGIVVVAAPTSQLIVTGLASPIVAGASGTFTVMAKD